jgi:hypothetical protein
MPDHAQFEEAKRIVAQAAENYQRDKRPILEVLAEFRESITILRSKGATLGVIAEVLRQANIVVSLATLGRFCKTLAGASSAKTRKRKRLNSPSRKAVSEPKSLSPPLTQKPSAISQQVSSGETEGGPRIPNLATL